MRKILTQEEAEHLAGVIAELEQKTDGEIRLMIVSRSSRTGHVMFTLWMVLAVLTFLTLGILQYEGIFSGWYMWEIFWGAFFVATLLSRFHAVQRALTPFSDLNHSVWMRAEVEFHREGIGATENRTGILIFLSLFERQAVVLADEGINKKTDQKTWDEVIKQVLLGARTQQWAKQLESALRECGKQLAQHFPPREKNVDELPNFVIIKD